MERGTKDEELCPWLRRHPRLCLEKRLNATRMASSADGDGGGGMVHVGDMTDARAKVFTPWGDYVSSLVEGYTHWPSAEFARIEYVFERTRSSARSIFRGPSLSPTTTQPSEYSRYHWDRYASVVRNFM